MEKKTDQKREVSGYLRDIDGIWHIVIVYYDHTGKRKFPSVSTKLKTRGNKKKATKLMEYLISVFEIPKEGEKTNLRKYLNANSMHKYKELAKSNYPSITNKKKKPKKEKSNKITKVSEDMLFADFLLYWVKAARGSFEENTYGSYHANIKSSIAPYFKEREIALKEITTFDIQEYISYCLNDGSGKQLSPNTVLKRFNHINQALKYAVNLNLRADNPASAVIKPKKRKFEGSAYSQEELNYLFQIFKNDPLELAVYLASFYGFRREEVVGLKWQSIDFENHTIKIASIVTSISIEGVYVEVEKERAKTEESRRTYPLVKLFEDLLLKMKKEQEQNKKIAGRSYNHLYEDYVYVDKLGNRIKPGYITQHFSLILKKNKARHIRFQDLRHTCATQMLMKGENLVKVQKWLGHSNIQTTANVYSHLDFNSKIDSANNLLDIMPPTLI